jgi:hypothetical protein
MEAGPLPVGAARIVDGCERTKRPPGVAVLREMENTVSFIPQAFPVFRFMDSYPFTSRHDQQQVRLGESNAVESSTGSFHPNWRQRNDQIKERKSLHFQ